MRVLVLDAALNVSTAAIVIDDSVLAELEQAGNGHAATLPALASGVMSRVGLTARSIDAITATVGPGSFTGIRAALSLGHGLAMGAHRALVGVMIAEALAESLPRLGGRALWVAIRARKGRLYLDRHGRVELLNDNDVPLPDRPVAIAGDGAVSVAATLAARGADVMLTDARRPLARHIAVVARQRLEGHRPPLASEPLYIEPPLAMPPAGGLRPSPN